MSGFGEMRGMTQFEIDMWNGGYGPDGAWWKRDDDQANITSDSQQATVPSGTAAGAKDAQTKDRDEIARLKMIIERLAQYISHDEGCRANDLDPLDHSPCSCGLRQWFSPKGLIE